MSATRFLVNGREAGVDPADRGLAYGDGLFETMAWRGGRVRWLDYHRERLTEGCRRLGFAPPDWGAVREEIARLAPPGGDAVVKLIVTRGPGERGYGPPARPTPTRILSAGSWPEPPVSHYTRGVSLRSCALRVGENPRLAGLKHLCRLEQVLAQQELEGSGADEGVLLDASGFLVGGTSSNLFAVLGGELLTPALTRCGVKGVMRRVVLERAPDLGLRPVEQDIEPAALDAAEELFITNAVFGVKPVRELDGRPYPIGTTTRALRQLLEKASHA